MYRPPKKLWPQIAPTEIDNNLRHRLVKGEVHDENAFAIGGVSGHAGLFSAAPDLAAFCQMLLNGGVYAHQRIFAARDDRAIHDAAAAFRRHANARLGVPTEGGSSGHYFSAHSFGPHGIHWHVDLDRPRTGSFLWCC